MSAENDLQGRVALITGASGGIGGACARKLAPYGVDLALTYSSNKTAIDELVAQLQKDFPAVKITSHQADLSNTEQTLALCEEAAKAHGKPISILISNAGRGKRYPQIWDIPVEEFDLTIATNLKASFLLVKGVAEGMRDQKWGRIVFISSIAAYGAGVNGAHYAASKGGQLGMMKNLSTRLVEYGITVNDVAPAMIGDTGMFPSTDTVPGVVDTIPVGRLGKPDEVANAVEMFVKTPYCTGQSVVVAGGLMHK
ncbi:3-ketoacyl-acyl carrier protein reductase [Lasiodiplodia theobromae]|uniref:3-ketoacyl-acyl carrier protein reductase n=1 Tax=Lasiodiplodia theobromae TaxID=45133 RepID=UPI0015C367F8|nr:3-ketoacyl-acyl carrier protein reductase [Lasiodiplodia theobromae]KAF4542706.1 3-ketoacyl-acyl carrier protein reductase [Lasiodiplodia theobromae]